MKLFRKPEFPKDTDGSLSLLLYFVAALIVPNILLAFTEHYPFWTVAVSLLVPSGFYLIWGVLLRRSGVMVWLGLPFMVLGAFQLVLLYLFGNSIIAVDMFTNLRTTNPDEAGELLGNIYPSVIGVCVLYLPLLFLAGKAIRRHRIVSPRLKRGAMGAGVAMLAAGGLMSLAAGRSAAGFRAATDLFPVNVMYNMKLSVDEWKRVLNYRTTSAGFRFEARRPNPAPEREVYVLVIGEASRYDSWSLFGYGRETNPLLARQQDLLLFKNVLTQSNTTHKSVPIILSSCQAEDHDSIYQRKGVIALFREAGFKTLFVSNQAPNNALIDRLAAEADRSVYLSRGDVDGSLLPYVDEALRADSSDLLVVLHTYGSHYSYDCRYPRSFARFTPDTDVSINKKHKQQIVNAYDNSVLYTDQVLSTLIDLLRERGDICSALFYCADHGEDLFDDDRHRFLHSSPTTTYYQLHVASVGWTSERYRMRFPERAAAARDNVFAPATTGAVFHTMAGMAGIESPWVDMRYSLFGGEFDYAAERHYLNDHNRAVRFEQTGLREQDKELFSGLGIAL